MNSIKDKLLIHGLEPYRGNPLFLWLNLESEIAKGNFSISVLLSEIIALTPDELFDVKKYLREQVELFASERSTPISLMSQTLLDENSAANVIDHEVEHMLQEVEFDASGLRDIKLMLVFSIREGELWVTANVVGNKTDKFSPFQSILITIAPKILSWGDLLIFESQILRWGKTLSDEQIDAINFMLSQRKELKADGSIQEIGISQDATGVLSRGK